MPIPLDEINQSSIIRGNKKIERERAQKRKIYLENMSFEIVSYFVDLLNVSHLYFRDIKIFKDIPKSFSIQQRNQENINIKIYRTTHTKEGSHGT